MHLSQRFQEFIKKENLFSQKDRLLLAVSGGLDSSVLCDLCSKSDFEFVIAHCNFNLRGDESIRDEKFVRALGKKYNKEVLVKHFDTEKYAAEHKLSIQVAARELRYAWFNELMDANINKQSSPFNHLVTAHHLDDNIETLLMHFFRGTGIAGLRAIPTAQGKIVRPLLFARKEELKVFADENRLEWIEDSSNDSDKYSRNYFRHHLIPIIQKIYPEVINNLAANIDRFGDVEILYRQSIDQQKKKLLEQKGDEVHIPVLKLKKLKALRAICYGIIKEYGFSSSQVDEFIHLLDSESGKYILSSTHRVIKNRNWLIIAPNQNESSQTILIEKEDKSILFPLGKLQIDLFSATDHKLQIVNTTAQLDADQIEFPLILRKWTRGDYFYPFGMTKKKKLSRFFIDEKVSKTGKEKIWVIEMNKKIIWIVGMRIDNRFKISPQTKRVLKIEVRTQ
ncbi:MAG: tRNA lysidine(34) synthetase TilS [Bacteroidetes bacterium]|nr:tRNA lysidine(34) synthetase TilS [Bacteroidota bacterium]